MNFINCNYKNIALGFCALSPCSSDDGNKPGQATKRLTQTQSLETFVLRTPGSLSSFVQMLWLHLTQQEGLQTHSSMSLS